jgi:hypothetical protein
MVSVRNGDPYFYKLSCVKLEVRRIPNGYASNLSLMSGRLWLTATTRTQLELLLFGGLCAIPPSIYCAEDISGSFLLLFILKRFQTHIKVVIIIINSYHSFIWNHQFLMFSYSSPSLWMWYKSWLSTWLDQDAPRLVKLTSGCGFDGISRED